ncbi:MAG: hypothetical protein ACRDHW_06825 [Ktedonobacteraceae bacterium]
MKSKKCGTLLALALCLGMLLSLAPLTSNAFAQSATPRTEKGAAQVANRAVKTQIIPPVYSGFNQFSGLGQLNQLGRLNRMNQFNETNQLNRINQLGRFNGTNLFNRTNQFPVR